MSWLECGVENGICNVSYKSPAASSADQMQYLLDGALLISTLIPFEGADGEDSTALSVGEMITKVQTLRIAMNTEIKAASSSSEIVPIPQCEHLWVVSGVSSRISLKF